MTRTGNSKKNNEDETLKTPLRSVDAERLEVRLAARGAPEAGDVVPTVRGRRPF